MHVVLLGDGGSAVERLGPTFASEGSKPCLAAFEGVKKPNWIPGSSYGRPGMTPDFLRANACR